MRTFNWLQIAALSVAALGCSEPEVTCHPVSGQVLQAKEPLAEAMVVLHPLDAATTLEQKPIAYADADGRFWMTTYQSGDGAPTGAYAITVELRAPRSAGEEVVRDGRNLLPPRYASPETSGLKVNVVDGENIIPPIDVATR
jgi:hypothetical protein